MSELHSNVYNYVTKSILPGLPTTDEEAMQRLSDEEAMQRLSDETAQELYKLYREMGDPLLVAYEHVLQKITEAYEAAHGESHEA